MGSVKTALGRSGGAQANNGEATTITRSNILPNDTSACEVGHIAELVTMIVDFFNADVNPTNKGQKALLPLTTVNKMFFEATVNHLWRCMPSVGPFVQLLPPLDPDNVAEDSKGVINSLETDVWERVRFYARRTRSLKLTAGAEVQKFPVSRLFWLFQRSSSPPFPNLRQLTVSSMQGVNSIFSVQSLKNLRTVWISDSLERDNLDARHDFIISLMRALKDDSHSLWKMTLKPTLTRKMASVLTEMTSLTSLTVTMLAPVRTNDLMFLRELPNLETLSLATHGPAYSVVYPERRNLSTRTLPVQQNSRLSRLTLEGDPFFIYRAATFFCSPSLDTFVGIISPKLYPGQFPGLLLMSHILYSVIDSNPEVQEFSLEWDGCFDTDAGNNRTWDWHDSRLTIPADLGKALGRLSHLEKLVIRDIPIPTTDFFLQLLDALPYLPSLQTLDLVPIQIDQDDIVDFPPMVMLVSIHERFPALRHLTLSMKKFLDIPPGPLQIVHPHHPLETLFIVPGSDEPYELDVSTSTSLSRYLHCLFPNLQDITSYFDDDDDTLTVWRNVDSLIKTYQEIRAQVISDLQRNAQVAIGGDVDMDHD